MARELARERHPGLGVFGEEQGDDPGTAGARLIVDPIDGTVSFVRGIPVFGTLLAIEAEGEVVAGVASAPALGARWHAARGSGAFSGPRRLRVSEVGDLHQAMLFLCDLGSGGSGPPPGIMRLLARVGGVGGPRRASRPASGGGGGAEARPGCSGGRGGGGAPGGGCPGAAPPRGGGGGAPGGGAARGGVGGGDGATAHKHEREGM